MEKYEILGIKVKTYEGKNYYHCYVLHETDRDFNVIDVKINEKQVGALEGVVRDTTFDVKQFLTINYNNFKKAYEPKLTFGL